MKLQRVKVPGARVSILHTSTRCCDLQPMYMFFLISFFLSHTLSDTEQLRRGQANVKEMRFIFPPRLPGEIFLFIRQLSPSRGTRSTDYVYLNIK